MGEIQNIHHSENKGETCRNEKKKSGVRKAVEKKTGMSLMIFLSYAAAPQDDPHLFRGRNRMMVFKKCPN